MPVPVPSGSALARQFPSLRSRDYSLLFTNSVFAAGANWALLLARGWLVFKLTGSSLAVGVVTFAGMAPFLFASPIAGALADRVDRRAIALVAAYISLAGTIGLAIVTLAGIVEVWQIIVFSLLGGIARAAQMPAQQAMIPNLVPQEDLLNAIALASISQHGSRLAGPVFGAILLTTAGPGSVFVLSAGFLLAGTVALWMIRYRSVPQAGAPASTLGRLFTDIGVGIEHVGRDPRLALVIVLVIFHCALTMAFDSLMPQLATDVGGGANTFSAILMGLGAGAVAGTLVVSRLPTEAAQGRALLLTGLGSGLAMVVLGAGTTPAAVVAGAVLAGGTQASFMALTQAMVQSITTDALRGRVMSIYVMLASGHMAFVNLGFGAGADLIGVRPLLIVPGLLWTAVLVGALVSLPDLRHLVRHGTFAQGALLAAPAATPEAAG